jgi:hypothetical protein
MFTLNGIRKVNCSLSGDCVVIGENQYEISSIKNITSFKWSINLASVLLLIMAVVSGSFFASEYFGGGDKIGALFLLAAFALTTIGAAILIWLAIIQKRSRSQWRINFYHMLYVEETDPPNIDNVLASLPVPDETTLKKPPNNVITRADKVVLVILAVLVIASFQFKTPYWAETLLLLPGYLAYLRLKDVMADFRNMKWQKY